MKKLIALLLLLALTGCTVSDKTAETGRAYYDIFKEENKLPYVLPEKGTTVDGIFAEDFTIQDSRYYFEIKHAFDIGGGVRMLAYTDISTGDYEIVCQNPQCSHSSPKVCKYADLGYYCFTDKPGIIYAVRMNSDMQLCRIDLNEDRVEDIHKLNYFDWDLLGYSNGKMYFREKRTVTEDKNLFSYTAYCYVDDANREVVEFEKPKSEYTYSKPLFVRNGDFYLISDSKIIRTDPMFENFEVIADTGMPINQWYLDSGTEEIYFSCIDVENRLGSVYVVKDDVPEKVNLPYGEIYSFTINHEKIYYTVYDPVYLGISAAASYYAPEEAEKHKTYDYTGGKLYAADRNNPSSAELIYEVQGLPMNKAAKLESAVVVGDYLYMDVINILRDVREGREYVSFDYARDVSKIRIGLKDGSLVRIDFE